MCNAPVLQNNKFVIKSGLRTVILFLLEHTFHSDDQQISQSENVPVRECINKNLIVFALKHSIVRKPSFSTKDLENLRQKSSLCVYFPKFSDKLAVGIETRLQRITNPVYCRRFDETLRLNPLQENRSSKNLVFC